MTTRPPPRRPSQLQQFVGTLYHPQDVVEIRRIKPGHLVNSTWHRAVDIPSLYDALTKDNQAGWNIYAGANPRPAYGARGDDCIRIAHSVFIDLDDVDALTLLTSWPERFKLPMPSLCIDSGHGLHAYWPLTNAVTDLAAWRELQRDLAHTTGGDPTIHNFERIMRLPGFLNVKREPHVPCRIIDSTGEIFDYAELRASVPPRPKPVGRPIPIGSTSDASMAQRYAACLAYLRKCPDAISGQYGHKATIRAACECIRFGLDVAHVWQAMAWWNGSKCIPPWSEKELSHKISEAIKLRPTNLGIRMVRREQHKPVRMPSRRSYIFTVGAA